MKRYRLLIFPVIFLTCFNQAFPQFKVKSVNEALKDTTLEQVVRYVRINGFMRLNYIGPSYTQDEALTVKRMMEKLELIPRSELTEANLSLLDHLKSVAKVNENSFIGYDFKLFTIKDDSWIKAKSFFRLFQIIISDHHPEFTIVESKRSFLVAPKTNLESTIRTSLVFKKLKPKEALEKFKEVLSKNKIGFADMGFSSIYLKNETKKVSLNLKNKPLPIIISRFSELFGSDLVWTLQGQEGHRMVQFTKFNPVENPFQYFE